MTIDDMHYDFKKKINKVDSNQHRNLLVPEIDWVLNEAQDIFIKWIASPRLVKHLGFEKTQRNIDDLKEIVEKDYNTTIIGNTIVSLPEDYYRFLKGKLIIKKNDCVRNASFIVQKHDNEYERDTYHNSSYEWGEVTGTFYKEGIRLDLANFTVDNFFLTYLRKPLYMHNADKFNGGQYDIGSGTLTGTQDCELAEETHREIVDIAVLITSGELQLPDYQTKLNKVNMNINN